MKKVIVFYYSNTGNNRYLAQRVAKSLSCEAEEIKPSWNFFPFLLFSTLTGISFGLKSTENKIEDNDQVILCGPVWLGYIIAPIRDFIKEYREKTKSIVFITCCGSSYEKKDDKFGHAEVFKKIQELGGETIKHCEAFPITLVVPEDKRSDNDAMMKARLSDETFQGEIKDRVEKFISDYSANFG